MARRLSLSLLLALCLAIGSPLLGAQNSSHKGGQRALHRAQAAGVADRLSQVWQGLTALWGAEGCILDPNGARCANATATTGSGVVQQPSPEGCGLDPDGCR